MRTKAGMASLDNNGTAAKRLRSWKEIASFFGANERTVRRWEERGLPVHRVPGGARATIYADTAELERWFKGARDKTAAPTETVRGVSQPGSERAALRNRPSQSALDLYTAAVYQTERATPDSLRLAIGLYGRAIAEDLAYAEAYAGLAGAYIRLRTFAAVSEAEAYPRARAAAERAIELDPDLAHAHAAIGYVSFYADWDFERGLRHFSEAARLDSREAAGRYQYGLALLHSGDFPAALSELEAAQRLDPRMRGILATRGFVLYLLSRREEGLALIRQVAADDPDYMLAHHYLSLIYTGEGEWRAGLAEGEIVARLRQDEGRLALGGPARRALDEGGGDAMLRVLLAGQMERYEAGREPAYVLAEFHALLGEHAEALRWLRRSISAREPLALTMRIDPLLRNLRADPEFQELTAHIGKPG
jgi:tetratricopeptide (TPR) repeat protein